MIRTNARGEIVMPLSDFRHADFGQVCQYLGVRPSKPHVNAAGQNMRRRHSRRSRPTPERERPAA